MHLWSHAVVILMCVCIFHYDKFSNFMLFILWCCQYLYNRNVMSNGRMIFELERILKEAVCGLIEILFWHLLERLRKPAKILIQPSRWPCCNSKEYESKAAITLSSTYSTHATYAMFAIETEKYHLLLTMWLATQSSVRSVLGVRSALCGQNLKQPAPSKDLSDR
jgi:hypothetical protein